MQIINHKNASLTVCQKFFIEKSLELLYLGSIDSYRVRLNNPKKILEELNYCLEQFELKRIKHFFTIKAKDNSKKALIDEAASLINSDPSYLTFDSISKDYLNKLFKNIDEFNYKKVTSAVHILLNENANFLKNVISGLEELLKKNDNRLCELEKIDKTMNSLFSELISIGFSKGFLYKLVYGIFVSSRKEDYKFEDYFHNFKKRILDTLVTHEVIFRIDTTQKVYDSISAFPHPVLKLSDSIDDVQLHGRKRNELKSFNAPASARKFITCSIQAIDYLAALKKARSILSEYLDVIDLGLSDEFPQIHHRALVIDSRSPNKGGFQNNRNIMDGKYRVEKEYYLEFTRKLSAILKNENIIGETKEKIKSAIRYLRLGNQSTEVEHKFINYWIGLEYLFSNYESQNTINRIKEHFINADCLAYVKRNIYSFKKSFLQLSTANIDSIISFKSDDESVLAHEAFYNEIGTKLFSVFPLLAYRALKLKQWFFREKKEANAMDYLKSHRANLEIHFSRIYRLRNEIIHDAATNTNNEQIASNLRYYLTFILNELIDFLSKSQDEKLSIENYFILNEIKLGNIEQNGFLLNDLLNVDCSINFIS